MGPLLLKCRAAAWCNGVQPDRRVCGPDCVRQARATGGAHALSMHRPEHFWDALQQAQGPGPSPMRPSGLSRPSPPPQPHAAHAQVSLGVGMALQQQEQQQQSQQSQQPRPGRPRAPVINPFAAAQQRMQVHVDPLGSIPMRETPYLCPLHTLISHFSGRGASGRCSAARRPTAAMCLHRQVLCCFEVARLFRCRPAEPRHRPRTRQIPRTLKLGRSSSGRPARPPVPCQVRSQRSADCPAYA